MVGHLSLFQSMGVMETAKQKCSTASITPIDLNEEGHTHSAKMPCLEVQGQGNSMFLIGRALSESHGHVILQLSTREGLLYEVRGYIPDI